MKMVEGISSSVRKYGWIFSPMESFLIFWLPIPFILAWWSLFGNESHFLNDIYYILILKIPFDMGHVLATAFPLLRRTDDGHLTKLNFFLSCIGVLAVSCITFYYSSLIFYIIITLVAITHICRQQYGWVMLSRRQASEPSNERWIDAFMIANVMLAPLIWWQSELGPVQKYYLFPNNIHFYFNAAVAQFVIVFHWVTNIIFVLHLGKKYINQDAINWGKISIIISTWIWFYGSLVILESRRVFLAELVLIHGVAYIVYSYKASKKEFIPTGKTRFLWSTLSNPWTYTLFLVSLGALWFLYVNTNGKVLLVNSNNMVEALIWQPLLLHYYFDTFIWRRKMFKSSEIMEVS